MSLKEIAARAGTSVSTVSRVLNGSAANCASRKLQDRIWEIARQTGYQPNETARALRKPVLPSAGLPRVSIVLTRISSPEKEPFFAELLRNLQEELFRQHAATNEIIFAEDSLSQDLSHADGVILLGKCPESMLNHIRSQNRNVIGIWRNPMNFDVDEVVCDGKKAAELAMSHLLSLGHRRIAYIGDCSFESRYVGYCDMLIRNNLPMNYELIRQTDQSREEAEEALLDLLEKRNQKNGNFSAILCANDNTAIRVLELLAEHKKSLRPSPVSVISIDDIEEAQNTKPYLTTIHIPRPEMAHMAVLLLLDRIAKGHTRTVRSEFACQLMQRASCYPFSDILH